MCLCMVYFTLYYGSDPSSTTSDTSLTGRDRQFYGNGFLTAAKRKGLLLDEDLTSNEALHSLKLT